MKFIHEYDERGNHRLRLLASTHSTVDRQGDWASYTAPATLNFHGSTFVVATAYFAGAEFQPDTVYHLVVADARPEVMHPVKPLTPSLPAT